MTKGDLRWIKNWQPQQIGNNMNRFYKKPKQETMKKNRETYAELYKEEIKWLKDNLQTLTEMKNNFMIEMYTILITGSRKITPKMANAIMDGIKRCNNNPRFNDVLRIEQEAKLKPILEKIVKVERLAEQKNDKGQSFVRSIKQYVQMNYRITKKQMEGLNEVYKRCSEDLFKGDE